MELKTEEFSGVLRCDRFGDLDKLSIYIGDSYPTLFVECFAGAGGTTITLLLRNRVQLGVVVVGDPYLGAFWREALTTDNLIHKVKEFRFSEANIKKVVNNPDRDPAFWTLVKSRCSWRGRLDRKAFLEWDVAKYWDPEAIIKNLLVVRSLSDRLEIVEARGIEVLKQFGDATALIHYPFEPHDKWNETLREKWYSEQEQEKLFQILASRKGRWIVPDPTDRMVQRCEAGQFGLAWMVINKMTRPTFFRNPILVSDRQFAAEQNDLSFTLERQFQDSHKQGKSK